MKNLKRLLAVVLVVIYLPCIAQVKNIFIALNGSDKNNGSKQYPFATIARAQKEVRKFVSSNRYTTIYVRFKKGLYFLQSTVVFSNEDGGSDKTKVIYTNSPNEKVIISGGIKLTDWKNENGIWTKELPKEEVENGAYYFRQLFTGINGIKRLERAALYSNVNKEYFHSKDVLSAYKKVIKKWDFAGINNLRKNDPAALCGFTYQGDDIIPWPDFKQAELITHHSWESSWQTIKSIDTLKKEVFFNSPSCWPVGFFGNGGESARYRIENIKAALDEPGEWMIDKENHKLLYIPFASDNINNFTCIAPYLKELFIIRGSNEKKIQNLFFENITFSHTAYSLGIYIQSVHQRDIAPPFQSLKYDWPKHAKTIYGSWPENFQPGYSEPQAAIHVGQAVTITNTTNSGFEKCHFTGLGNYAIKVGDSSNFIKIKYNKFSNLGGGGILIGEGIDVPSKASYPYSAAPNNIEITDNLLFETGKVFYGSVGIFLGQTHHNIINYNELHDMPYSAISMGWTWGSEENYVSNNTINNNHIHHVMKVLADGGAIYTLGKMKNCTINNNHIHDVIHQEGALGGGNGGIFFDHGSSDVEVKNNLIYYISLSPLKFNSHSTNPKDLKINSNYLEVKPYTKDFPLKIMTNSGIRNTNHNQND